jgi:RHS repeat-associated protein
VPVGLGVPDTGGAANVGGLATVDPSTGTLNVSYPFELPAARGKDQPSLSVHFSSSGGDGDAGWAWNLSLQTIERKSAADTASPAYDDVAATSDAPQQIGTDHFSAGGAALVPICQIGGDKPCDITGAGINPGTDGYLERLIGWYYFRAQVEHGPGTAFLWSPTHATWLALQPSGTWLAYGAPSDTPRVFDRQVGLVGDTLRDGTKVIQRWGLAYQHDAERTAAGNPSNPIVYLWDGAQLTDIYDTPLDPDNTTLDGFAHHTRLAYEPFFVPRTTVRASHGRPAQRLKNVDVTSQDMGGGARSKVRRYHFKYALENGHANHEHLTSIVPEGRCTDSSANSLAAGIIFEGSDGAIPEASPICDNSRGYPATYFTYSGSEKPDLTLHQAIPAQPAPPTSWCSIPSVPPYPDCRGGCPAGTEADTSNCETIADGIRCTCFPRVSFEKKGSFLDVNGDGLPDMLMPFALFDPPSAPQKLCLNHGNDRFTCDGTLSLQTKSDIPIWTSFYGDFRGTGNLDMLLSDMPATGEDFDPTASRQKFELYSLAPVGASSFQWKRGSAGAWNFLPPSVDRPSKFKSLTEVVKSAADFDGDGLSDLLVYRSAIGDPEHPVTGLGAYGAALTRRFADGYIRPFNLPIVPYPASGHASDLTGAYRGDNIPFWQKLAGAANGIEWQREKDKKLPAKSAAFEFADMNGDGLADVVAVTADKPVQYWPGFGDGTFGNVACGLDVVQENGHPVSVSSCHDAGANGDPVSMTFAPGFDPAETLTTFHDVNGDGYADLVVANATLVDVYENHGGTTFQLYLHIDASTLGPLWSDSAKLNFADLNGSGSEDLIFANTGVGYIDPIAGVKPGLLTGITNSNGVVTTVGYATTAQLDNTSVSPWGRHSAQNMHVVQRLEVNNGLAAPHRIASVSEYTYRDPVFEPRSHTFRGFESVAVAHPGDEIAPGSVVSQSYLVGQCVRNPGEPCPLAVDNPFDALRGLVASSTTSTYSGGAFIGSPLSGSHSVYQVRRIAQGADGRAVRLVYPEQTDTFLYDPALFSSGASTTVDDVHAIDPGDQALSHPWAVPADGTPGVVHLRSSRVLDDRGRTTKAIDYGRVGTNADAPIVSTTAWYTPPGAVLGLISRAHVTNTGAADASGNLIDAGRARTQDYNAAGDLTDTTATLTGTLALTRSVAVPPSASRDGVVRVGHIDRDPIYGNAVRTTQPNDHVEDVGYDIFHQFATSKTVRTGTAATGFGSLTTSTTFDRGFGKAIAQVDPSGAMLVTTYDGAGRLKAQAKPSAELLGLTTDSVTIQYWDAAFDGIRFDGVRRMQTRTVVGNGANVPVYRDVYSLIDAFGSVLATATTADPGAGDGGAWLISGLTDRSGTGKVARAYVPMFGEATFLRDIPSPNGRPFAAFTYDALGRTVTTSGLDGAPASATTYHPLSTESYDAEDLLAGGPHANTPTVVTFDGHHRKVRTFEQSLHPSPSSVTDTYGYLPTGELATLRRTYDAGPYVTGGAQATYMRELFYDSLGRLVRNVEPNSQYSSDKFKVWRYAYDDAGEMVATNDARDCGENLFYDAAGRKLAEDFIPCEAWHAAYTAPDLATGAGTEAFYRYDIGESDQAPDNDAAAWKGRLVSVSDRGAHTRFSYDARGRGVRTSRRLVKPGLPDVTLDTRYSAWWFERTTNFDEADRPTTVSTGADVPELLENGASTFTTDYSARGQVKDIGSSYGTLVTGLTYDEDGSTLTRTRGDAAATTTTLSYGTFSSKRLTRALVARTNALSAWTSPPSGYVAPPDLQQLTLSDTLYNYDRVGNPTFVSDLSSPDVWPAGAKPVARSMEYDDRYRLTKVGYGYGSGNDNFVEPMPSAAPASSAKATSRVKWQSFEYDGVGNTVKTSDDSSVFWDRSLGPIRNGVGDGQTPGQTMVPNQISIAGDRAKRADGFTTPGYDKAGNMWSLGSVHPGAICLGGRTCVAGFSYEWDEIGRLAHASRTDGVSHKKSADLVFAYDADGNRVLTTNAIASTYNATVFSSLRLQATTWDSASSTFKRTGSTETAYLAGGARVIYSEDDLPSLSSGKRHVFFTLGDALGSTSMVIDKETSEVVERRTYQAYGAVEADYRPERWKGFREPFGFTGKEEDLEIGLIYFGARYYSPILGRWASPDPLTIHKLGADLNPYAYVRGQVYAATDPTGLADNAFVSTEPVCSGGGDGCTNTVSPVSTPAPTTCDDPTLQTCSDASNAHKATGAFDPDNHPEMGQTPDPPVFMGTELKDPVQTFDPRSQQEKTEESFINFVGIVLPAAAGSLSGAFEAVGEDTALSATAARATAVHEVLDPIAQDMRTTAALDTSDGMIIGGGKRDLTPAQRAALQPGEIAAKLPGEHAEVTVIQKAKAMRASPYSMSVTRTICPDCARAIEASNGWLTSETSAEW